LDGLPDDVRKFLDASIDSMEQLETLRVLSEEKGREWRVQEIARQFWCGIFFVTMALENGVLFVDVILVPHIDLSDIRRAVPLTGLCLLLYGLICEVKQKQFCLAVCRTKRRMHQHSARRR
jgi:hypothetical protein